MKIQDNTLFKNVNINNMTYTIKTFGKNQTVHNRGDECREIILVMQGSLIAYSLSQKGNENVVFNFNKGSVIGVNLLFGNVNRYPLNIYATSDCELICIPKEEVQRLLEDNNFAMNFIKNISLNSQGMNKKIAMSVRKNLRENIIEYFTALSVEQNSNMVLLPVSKKQLADYFGVQRPSFFRELKNMQDQKLIEISNKQVALLFLQSE